MRLAPSRTSPASGAERAGDDLQQRRLAGAVSAHHRPALAAADRQREPVVDDAPAVRLADVLEHGDLIARARRLAEVELHDAPLLGQLDLLDLVERLDAALHLRRLRRVRLEALDEALFLGEHRLLPRVRGLAVGLAQRALALVEVVVARIERDLAAVDLRDLRDDAVHEVAVVRRHEERAGCGSRETLEPDDRLDVEVVGRLVHQQHVGPAEQHARHRDAHLPAARQRADVAVDPLVVEAEPVQHLARLAFERVAAEMLVLLLHLAEAREDACPCRRRAPDPTSRAAAPRARGADRRAGRCRRWPRRGRSGRSSPRRPGGSSRSSASSGRSPRLRPAPLRRRSCGRASSCRRRSGPTRPTFSPGLIWKEASTKRICLPYCLLTLENAITRVHYGRARQG